MLIASQSTPSHRKQIVLGGSLSRLLKAGMPLILMPLLRTPDLGILMQRSGAGSIQSARDPYLPAGTAIGPGKRAT